MAQNVFDHLSVNRNRVRWQIILYVIATYSITYLLGQYIFVWMPTLATKAREWWPFILMWIPGTVAFIFRFLFLQGFRDVGWSLGQRKYWVWAVGGPLVIISLIFLCAYVFGIVHLSLDITHDPLWQGATEWFRLSWPDWTPETKIAQSMLRFGVVSTLVLAESFVYALGEELGWRGYLQTRLVQSGWPFPLLLGGLIWAGWHLPFLWWVILGGYSLEGITRAILFTTTITFMGVFIGWLRLASGSVLVATAMHAAHNAFIGFFTITFRGENAWLWVSEAGIFTALAYGSLAFWLFRSGKIEAVESFRQINGRPTPR